MLLRPLQNYAATYLDDVVIHLDSWEEHLDWMRRVLMELWRAGLTANPKKCHLGLAEAKYLGYQVSRGLIQLQSRKIEAVQQAARPTNKTQVHAFLGLAGYYRCFIVASRPMWYQHLLGNSARTAITVECVLITDT